MANRNCLIQINNCAFGSTGSIMRSIHETAKSAGWESHMLCPNTIENRLARKKDSDITFWGSQVEISLQRKWNKQTGWYCRGFLYSTAVLLSLLDKWNPSVVQIHNLHHQYLDIEKLFQYLNDRKIKVVWTLHDCWAFTGHCAHFSMRKCEKWKVECRDCSALYDYPATKKDKTTELFKQKRRLICSMKNLSFVAPSHWMKENAEESYLSNHSIKVINNGIDLKAFRPLLSDVRERYGLGDVFVILCVAMVWQENKGIKFVLKLAEQLGSPFRIVLVGQLENIKVDISDNILWIPQTNDKKELAELYTTANVFFNPTQEEVLGLVNIEALACGTPVITFPNGGSPECIDENSGVCLKESSVDEAVRIIKDIAKKTLTFSLEACRARAQLFDEKKCFNEYLNLYNQL